VIVKKNRVNFLLVVFCVVQLSSQAFGTTLAKVGNQALVNNSELIFEGKVIGVRSEQDQTGHIHTFVEFKVNDIIVGTSEIGTRLTLRFTGGTVGELRLDVGARIPVLNEKGIYFVEQVKAGLVNPLFGWTQGHLIIGEKDSVIAGNAQLVQAVKRESGKMLEPGNGVAAGIVTTPAAGAFNISMRQTANNKISRPMSVSGFKHRIQELRD
jgi:hypothetical protein